jgi:DNA repair protein SbcD/Mre11
MLCHSEARNPHAGAAKVTSRPSYPEPVDGAFNIGVLHTSMDGHANYVPCIVNDLIARGYDYWALDHVHCGKILCRNPHVVFPENLQGRHIRETDPKGA